jgi:hypothetical protein
LAGVNNFFGLVEQKTPIGREHVGIGVGGFGEARRGIQPLGTSLHQLASRHKKFCSLQLKKEPKYQETSGKS